MNDFYWLDQIQANNRNAVGDKAFYLSLLVQRGYPVVPGFVVSAKIFQAFLEEINWLEPLFTDLPNSSLHFDVDNPLQLQAIAQQIRQAIQNTPLSADWLTALEAAAQSWHHPTLILRPSLTLRQGLEPTLGYRIRGLLNAQICASHRDAIAHSLKQVWAELFRAKSLLYWQRSGIQIQQINLAVLMQPLQAALVAGEVQTDQQHFEIQSTWGLGRALTQGEVKPDYYRIHQQTEQIQQQQPGHKTHLYRPLTSGPNRDRTLAISPVAVDQQNQLSLSEPQLQQLTQLAKQLTAELSSPLVLEWLFCQQADASPALYLTQVCPRFSAPPEVERLAPFAQGRLDRSSAGSVGQPTHRFGSPVEDGMAESATLVLTGQGVAKGQVFAPVYVVSDHGHLDPAVIPAGVILVASSITPDWLPQLKQAVGVITEQGGLTGHGAIIARELGIPAVVGVRGATLCLRQGDVVFIDGDRGVIRLVPHAPPPLPKAKAIATAPQASGATNAATRAIQRLRLNATQLMVNLSQLESIQRVREFPVDGVGLLRSELMLLDALDQKHPQAWLQQPDELSQRIAERLRSFAEEFYPSPVFYRSLDLRSHEFSHLSGSQPLAEQNPMLGRRGTLSYQLDAAVFDAELAALRQVQQTGHDNVHLLLPFVRTVEEFLFCRQRAADTGLFRVPHFEIWIMAEVPSVLFLLPDYAQAGAKGISIGSNDLAQLLMAVDRDQPYQTTAFDPQHPAVMRAIAQLIQQARQAGLSCSICGQIPSQSPQLIEQLVQWGITAISVEPDAIEQTYEAIARAEHRLILEAARQAIEQAENAEKG